MKVIIFFCILSGIIYSQDNSDGRIDNFNQGSKSDYKGTGVAEQISLSELINQRHYKLQIPEDNPLTMTYTQFWSSPPGAFGNCWDGAVGFFDGDTLLSVAGYTFSPNMFYIWKQSPTNPDSFSIVFQYTKQEFGGFGPIAVGDVDGDGKTDIVLADFSTLTRVYIISNTGIGTYVSRETQGTFVHPNDGLSAQALLIGDLNKNGQKEIICLRGSSSPTSGMLRIWEHTGSPGTYSFTNIYTYNTVSYVFGKGGIGDSDGDGWDEVFLTYGGYDVYNQNIRKIHYDSASASFQYQIFTAPAIGLPVSYRVADVNNDGVNELISTNSSNGRAAVYIFKSTGPNQYQVIDSIFENSDPNTMMISDIRLLTGDTYPTILCASFGGRVYMYQYDGSHYTQVYENLNYPGSAIRRVYWLPWTGKDGYFNTWSSTNSNGTFYLFKRDIPIGIINNNQIIPANFSLEQNYPNPFNPTTKIRFEVPLNKGESRGLSVKLEIYDALGREIETLVNENKPPGTYEITWNASNYPSGVYFYKLVVNDPGSSGQNNGRFVETKKMLLIK